MTMPGSAIVLAAGLGERMRPLTLEKPKPLLQLGGKALIDYALDHLDKAGVTNVIVNLYYKGEMIRRHVDGRSAPRVRFSQEETHLEMGGGIVQALPLLGDAPFFILNSDTVWMDGPVPALQRLAEMWDPERMDALLLLVPRPGGVTGDYARAEDGRISYRPQQQDWPLSFRAASIAHPRLFDDPPPAPFSHKLLWDRAEAKGRLFGLIHDGRMFHLSTPDDLAQANAELAAKEP